MLLHTGFHFFLLDCVIHHNIEDRKRVGNAASSEVEAKRPKLLSTGKLIAFTSQTNDKGQIAQ